MQPIDSVLIAGGGTAGWLTAAYLARVLGTGRPGGVRITVVESSELPPIGVGEGSFPSIKGTLAAIGIAEARFLREAHATFKQGVHFAHWVRAPGEPGPPHYFHPFSLPSQRPGGPELLPYWLMGDAAEGTGFAEAATLQQRVAAAGRAPKRIGDADYQGPLNYAYHFDAGRLAALLAGQARALGVAHQVATIERVELSAQGDIAALHTADGQALRAGLYVDCTGFRAELIGRALGSRWQGLDDVLFVDRALALQVPHATPDAALACATISTAHEAGWTWDIALQQRRGIGYVYSSRHTDDARAEQVLRAYAGAAGQGVEPRLLTLQVGYRPVQWVGNCAAVGLSAGFLEPLESSGIGLIETAACLLAHLFPFDGDTARAGRHFNALMSGRFERVIDFVKLHYAISGRRDTAFWRDNTDPASWTDALRDKLALWRSRPPHRLDFVADLEMYPTASWQFVLYGMEYATDMRGAGAGHGRHADARREFETLREVAQRAIADLPPHRALVEHLCASPAAAAAPPARVAA
jgi:tryptophan halogenase